MEGERCLCVCAPQYLSAGTWISPKVSVSILVAPAAFVLSIVPSVRFVLCKTEEERILGSGRTEEIVVALVTAGVRRNVAEEKEEEKKKVVAVGRLLNKNMQRVYQKGGGLCTDIRCLSLRWQVFVMSTGQNDFK